MRIPRVFLSEAVAGRRQLLLDDEAAHHVRRVLRLRPGDRLLLFDGHGGEYPARLASIDGRPGADVDAHVPGDRSEHRAVTLWQAVCRGGRMDGVVEKATELGVRRIVPLLTRRAVVRLDGERGRARSAHWRRVATAACEQCGLNRVPEVTAPLELREALAGHDTAATGLWLDPTAEQHLASLLASASVPGDAALTLVVGPEGGFEEEEEAALTAAGFRPASLGPRVLRADTAGLAALAMVQAVGHARGGDG